MQNLGAGGRGPRTGPSQLAQIIELGVFLLLILPSLILALFVTPRAAGPESVDFASLAVGVIIRDIALVALIAFFLWFSGESVDKPPLAKIGWNLQGFPKEIGLGFLLFLPMTISAGILGALLRALGFTGPSEGPSVLTPMGGAEIGLAVLLVIVVAIAEETIFRGYLMLRFYNLTRSLPLAIVASSLIFAIGHGYQGGAGLLAIGFIGIQLACIYAWRGTLVAVTTMHFLQDFISIVLAPQLASFVK